MHCILVLEKDTREVHIAERLFNSGLVAIVRRAAPSALELHDQNRHKLIITHIFNADILGVKLNRKVSVSKELA